MATKHIAGFFTVDEIRAKAQSASPADKKRFQDALEKYSTAKLFNAREHQEAIAAKQARSIEEKLKRLHARRNGLDEAAPIDPNYKLFGEPRAELLGSAEDVDKVIQVILANGGEAHKDPLQGTDYRITKAEFRSKLAPALLKECGVGAISASMYSNRSTGTYVKVKGWSNYILMKVGQGQV
jgi:hypothetical protein